MLTSASYWNKPEVQLPAACKTAILAWADRHRWWYLSNKDAVPGWISLQTPPSFPVASLPFSTTSVLFLLIKPASFHLRITLKLSHSIRCFQLDGLNTLDSLTGHVSLQILTLASCTCQMTTKQLALTSHRRGQEKNCPQLCLGPRSLFPPFHSLPLKILKKWEQSKLHKKNQGNFAKVKKWIFTVSHSQSPKLYCSHNPLTEITCACKQY